MIGEVVAEHIDSVFHGSVTLLVNLLHFNYVFVSTLAASFHTIVVCLCNVLCSVVCACGYALNDLVVFLSEIIGGIILFMTFISETIDYIKLVIQYFVNNVIFWITTVINSVWRTALTLLHLVSFLVGLFFSATLLLLQLIPNIFLQVLQGLSGTISHATSQIKNAVFYIREIPKRILDIFLEIPPGAYLGCIMLLVSFITIKVVRYFLRTFSFDIQEFFFLNKVKFFLQYGYTMLVTFKNHILLWLSYMRGDMEIEDGDSQAGSEPNEDEYHTSDTNDENESIYTERIWEQRVRKVRLRLETSEEESEEEIVGRYNVNNLKSKLQKERERLLCVVCQDNYKSMMLLPCRHLCMCQNCVSVIMEDRNICPICRRPIHEVMRVYI